MVDYGLPNFLTGIVLVLSAVAPLITAHQVNIRKIRNLTYLLALALVLHGLYHIQDYTGQFLLSNDVLGSGSVVTIVFFAAYLYRTTFQEHYKRTDNQAGTPIPTVTASTLGAIAISTQIIGGTISIAGLFISLGIFGLMIYRHPSIRSLHFQFSIALGMWVVSEIFHYFERLGIPLLPSPDVRIWIHFASMVALAAFVNYRALGFLKAARGLRNEFAQ
jgi:hypothetical protein